MATTNDMPEELREDVPLKRSGKSSKCFLNDNCLGGSRFINVSFTGLTVIITIALLMQIYYGDYQVVPHGSVASDSKECSEIGTSILKNGGNAVDACIASAFCLAVVSPHSTGLDSRGLALIYNHRTRINVDVVDFNKVQKQSPMLPRMVIGLIYIHQKYGSMTWRNLVLSAARIARKGFFVSKMLVNSIQHEDPEYFNKTLTPGETITIEKLGETLENIADIKIEDLYKIIPKENLPKVSEAVKTTFNNYNIFVPNVPQTSNILFENLLKIEAIRFNQSDIGSASYISRIAQEIQTDFNDLHEGTSSNIAVMDLNDLYVSFISWNMASSGFRSFLKESSPEEVIHNAVASPFGSKRISDEGYFLDVNSESDIQSRTPVLITDDSFVCGRRMVLGANDVVTATQVVATLLIAKQNATASIESPRFNIFNKFIGTEDEHVPVFRDDVLVELEKRGRLTQLKKPYSSCNIVEKYKDNLNSHSDSRGGGISSRF